MQSARWMGRILVRDCIVRVFDLVDISVSNPQRLRHQHLMTVSKTRTPSDGISAEELQSASTHNRRNS
jgi:hypothetical protein